MADKRVTLTIRTDDDNEETVSVSGGLLDLLAQGSESPADVAGDLVVMSLANRAHHMAHHGQGGTEGDVDIDDVESTMMEVFEDRFGQTFAEATGHDH